MNRTTNARLAGFTFLFYIVAGMASLSLTGRTHVTDVLSVLTSLSALVLGVTLYAITREQECDLAMLALVCRVVEAIPGDPATRLAWRGGVGLPRCGPSRAAPDCSAAL